MIRIASLEKICYNKVQSCSQRYYPLVAGSRDTDNVKARGGRIKRLQRIPYVLQPGPGTKLGLLGEEFFFFLIDLTLTRDEVDLVERDDFSSMFEFVAGPEDEEGRDSNIGCDKGIGLEGNEGVVTLEEGDEGCGG